MNFSGNRAVIGSTIYSSNLALCSWYSYYPPYFNISGGLRWPFISYGYVHNIMYMYICMYVCMYAHNIICTYVINKLCRYIHM